MACMSDRVRGRIGLAGVPVDLMCRGYQQCGAAAGEQGDYEVVWAGLLDEGKHLLAGKDAGFVGKGMTGLDDVNGGRCC